MIANFKPINTENKKFTKNFPLLMEKNEEIFKTDVLNKSDQQIEIENESGFYVKDDIFGDDYEIANAVDLPEDEINS